MTRYFTTAILIILIFLSCKQTNTFDKGLVNDAYLTKIDSIKNVNESLVIELENQKNQFKSLEFASSGDMIETETISDTVAYGFNYRVEIYLSEIYKSLYVTKIEYFGEGMQRIRNTNSVNLVEKLNINHEFTNGLEFVSWHTPTIFEIKIHDKKYILTINSDETTEIKETIETKEIK